MKQVTANRRWCIATCATFAVYVVGISSLEAAEVFKGIAIVSPQEVHLADAESRWYPVALSRHGELTACRHTTSGVVRFDDIGPLECHTGATASVPVSPDVSLSINAGRIAWLTENRSLEIRSYPQLRLLGSARVVLPEHSPRVRDLEISPDGKNVAVALAYDLCIYREGANGDWSRIKAWDVGSRTSDVVWSDDSLWLGYAVHGRQPSLHVARIDGEVREVPLRGFPRYVPGSKPVIDGLPDAHGNLTRLVPDVSSAVFSSDDGSVVAGGWINRGRETTWGFVGCWSRDTGELTSYVSMPGTAIGLVALCEPRKTVFVSCRSIEDDRRDVYELRLSDYGVVNVFRAPQRPTALAISADQKRLVALINGGTICVWPIDGD